MLPGGRIGLIDPERPKLGENVTTTGFLRCKGASIRVTQRETLVP